MPNPPHDAVGERGLDLAKVGGALEVGGLCLENVALQVRVEGLHKFAAALELRVRERQAGATILRLSGEGPAKTVELVELAAGMETVSARREGVPFPDAGWLGLHADQARVWASLDDATVCLHTDATARARGLCRVVASSPGALVIRAIRVGPQRPLPPIENWVETFAHEESMSDWGRPDAEWTAVPSPAGTHYWHRSDFWRELSVEMDLQGFTREPRDPCGVVLRGGDPRESLDFVRVGLYPTGDGPQIRFGFSNEVAEKTRPVSASARLLVLERTGGRLLVLLDDALLWDLPLPDGLRDLARVGRFGGTPGEAWARAVSIKAAGVQADAFKQAPVDWLPAAGAWFVTNRWQCDPRWSFFSGYRRPGVACNWFKGVHGENVTVEFFAGPKMDQDRGSKYEYAADLNAVISADGKDISSGYSFMFGGRDDRGSYILRRGKELARNTSVVIPRESSTHRRWFHIKVRRQGNRLSFWVDGDKVAEAKDTQPLDGNRFGLWTWDNGMMIAQVRISTDSDLQPAAVCESPPTVPRTPYD